MHSTAYFKKEMKSRKTITNLTLSLLKHSWKDYLKFFPWKQHLSIKNPSLIIRHFSIHFPHEAVSSNFHFWHTEFFILLDWLTFFPFGQLSILLLLWFTIIILQLLVWFSSTVNYDLPSISQIILQKYES